MFGPRDQRRDVCMVVSWPRDPAYGVKSLLHERKLEIQERNVFDESFRPEFGEANVRLTRTSPDITVCSTVCRVCLV